MASIWIYSLEDVTRLLCTCFESCWTLMHLESNKILSSWGTVNTVCKWGIKEQWAWTFRYLICLYTLDASYGRYLKNISLKIKFLRISRWWQQSIKPSARGLPELRALWDCTGLKLMKPVQMHVVYSGHFHHTSWSCREVSPSSPNQPPSWLQPPR